jgi:hypothetical protein
MNGASFRWRKDKPGYSQLALPLNIGFPFEGIVILK